MSEATSNAPLTVVLVHGAFADSSSWDGVIERLQAAGIQVTAAPNPLRGISHDSAYVASFIKQVPGPVLAVAHSYGGAVISNAATGLGNVVGLVFLAAFAPDEGERLGEVTAGSRDSVLGTAQVARQYPTPDGAGTATEFAIDPAKLHDVFAADLSTHSLTGLRGAALSPSPGQPIDANVTTYGSCAEGPGPRPGGFTGASSSGGDQALRAYRSTTVPPRKGRSMD